MSRLEIAAIIFDLDGLVLDSEASYFAAWRLAAAEMGHILNESFCAGLSGLPGGEVYTLLQQECGDDFDAEQFAKLSRQCWYRHLYQHPISIKPGLFTLLDLISQLKLPYALATNSRRQDAEFCLRNSGLDDVFTIIVCRDDVEHAKPAPDIVLKTADALGVAVSACLVLEDSPTGVAAAKSAGAHCIFVPSILPVDVQASRMADQVLADLGQVADFVSATQMPSL